MRAIFSRNQLLEFLIREWILTASLAGLILSSLILRRLPSYSPEDFEIIFVLAVFLALIRGLEEAGFFEVMTGLLGGAASGLKLLGATFFLSMVVTNDVSLVATLPVALRCQSQRKALLVVYLAIAANAGSSLSPFGNPQNLFIYWFYDLQPGAFIKAIAPLSIVCGGLLLILGLIFLRGLRFEACRDVQFNQSIGIYLGLFLALVATILKIFPLWLGWIILALAVFLDYRVIKVDYFLLLTFLCFFGLTDNLAFVLKSSIKEIDHVFWMAAFSSQLISNVPAALLGADFTRQWPALLWGVNVGGFGSLVGSLANLIAFRFYLKQSSSQGHFLLLFHLWGYLFFALGSGLFWLLY